VCNKRNQRAHGIPFALDRPAAAFLAVHDREHAEDGSPRRAHGRRGLERGRARRHHILDDDDRHPHLEATLDATSRPVRLRGFAHGERVHRRACPRRCTCDRVGDGVRSERQAADRCRAPAGVRDRLQAKLADQGEPLGMHGGAAAVHVVG